MNSTWRRQISVPLCAMAFTIVAADVAIAQPQFIVEVYNDFIFVHGWPADSTITATIDDPDNGVGIDFTKVQTGPADTGMLIHFFGEYDVQPGDYVEVTDGSTTLTHVVRNIAITVLDPNADWVEGTADPESTFWLNVGGPETGVTSFQQEVTADSAGNWVADLGSEGYDLLPGAWTSANQAGPDQGSTSFTLNPTFNVHLVPGPDNDFVHTWGWSEDVELTLTIDDPDTPAVDFERHVDSPPGGSGLNFEMGSFEIEQGFLVTITDGTSTVQHLVRELYVTEVNVSSGTMSVGGTAEPGSLVGIQAQTICGAQSRWVTADTDGNWVAASFCRGRWGSVWQQDEVANSTNVVWVVWPPVVWVDIDIKPGSYPNAINNDGSGVIPVAILGSAAFDVSQIDVGTVALSGMAIKAVGKADRLLAHYEDVNGDGFMDLVVQIQDQDGAFAEGTATATLTGTLLDGTPFEGSDEITIVR